jgi:hypothetical protein
MSLGMASHRGTSPGYVAGPLLGAALGTVVLGIGGRLAMRSVTLWEHRMHLFSLSGTASVILWGTALGCAAGLLRVIIEAVLDRWIPRSNMITRAGTFELVCAALALTLLTPWTLPRLVLFPPVVVGFLVLFELAWWRRLRSLAPATSTS